MVAAVFRKHVACEFPRKIGDFVEVAVLRVECFAFVAVLAFQRFTDIRKQWFPFARWAWFAVGCVFRMSVKLGHVANVIGEGRTFVGVGKIIFR